MKRLLRCALTLFFLLSALSSAPVSAHANFVRAIPAAGEALKDAPASVQIWFSEEVVVASSHVRVYDAAGVQVDTGETQPVPDDPRALVTALKPLDAGVYTVIWETLSAIDGHDAKGTFPFTVGMDAPTMSYAALVDQMDRQTRALQPPPYDDWLLKWWLILAFALLAGGMAFGPLMLSAGNVSPLRAATAPRRRRWLWLLWLCALGAVLLPAAIRLATTGVEAFAGRPGAILLARLVLLVLLGALLWLKRDETAWVLAPAGLLLLTQSLVSHSAAETDWVAPVLADWAHFVFTSIWLGGVAMLALVIVPATLTSRERLNQLGAVIARFSPWAMFCVFAIALTGIAQSASFVGSFDALFSTAYGRALLIKIALFAVLILFGVFHQQVIAPHLQAWRHDDAAASRAGWRFRTTILAELGVSVLLFVAVGALVSLPLSRDVAENPVDGQAAAVQAAVQTQSSDDVVLALGLSPATAPNQFVLRLSDANGNPIMAVEQAVLRFKSLSMDMGESELALAPYGDGYFVGQGNWLSMSGAWEVNAIVRRPGMADIRLSFTVDVP